MIELKGSMDAGASDGDVVGIIIGASSAVPDPLAVFDCIVLQSAKGV